MTTSKFKATVQYGDFKGSVAADGADREHPRVWLKNKKLMRDDEYLLGIELDVGENHGSHKDPVRVSFLFTTLDDHPNIISKLNDSEDPVIVRKIVEEMNISDFFGLFKRFSINLASNAIFEGKEYFYNE